MHKTRKLNTLEKIEIDVNENITITTIIMCI